MCRKERLETWVRGFSQREASIYIYIYVYVYIYIYVCVHGRCAGHGMECGVRAGIWCDATGVAGARVRTGREAV